ncbi:MAG: hypothetical protein AB7V36_14075 [Bacteroidales bacterium]|jgi:hypothetical protein|nr:hypothetical protein [Bacteroidales bacterium]
MKKIIFFISPLLFFLSCSKESVLPDEYQYLIGTWTLKNCIVSADFYTPHYPYSNSDTLPPDSFGFDQSIKIDDNSIVFYSENTIIQIVDNYTIVEVNTGTYGGEYTISFYLQYKDEIGCKKSTSVIYIPAKDSLRIYYRLYDGSSGTYYGPSYSYNYIRE